MAPQTNEFGTKVGLLAGLVVLCAARPLLDRIAARAAIGGGRDRPVRDPACDRQRGDRAREGPSGSGWLGARCSCLGVGIVAAGTPARGLVVPDTAEMLDGVPHAVDPATFPAITSARMSATSTRRSRPAQRILVTLAENLELENQALLRRDGKHPDRRRSRRPAQGDAGSAPGRQ